MAKTVQEIKDSVDSLFSDTSCSQAETKQQLEEIIEHIDECIGALDV